MHRGDANPARYKRSFLVPTWCLEKVVECTIGTTTLQNQQEPDIVVAKNARATVPIEMIRGLAAFDEIMRLVSNEQHPGFLYALRARC